LALRHPAVTLLIAALLLMAPSLVLGTLPSHSAAHNLAWASQFADQFRAGILYPRWMADSFDGLGSPAFYFYPPLSFWIDALVSAVTLNATPAAYRLAISAALLLWASGLAMHAWLTREGLGRAVALLGAIAYMAAPYHVLDHYIRGAYAEFAAYAFLPLTALAIRRIAEQRRGGVVILALSYAALLLSHLPTALLASATLLPAYVLFRAWRSAELIAASKLVARSAAAAVLGAGLAAIYLGPALGLQDRIASEQFWILGYSVEIWFLLTPERWLRPTAMMELITRFAGAYALASAGVLLVLYGKTSDVGPKADVAFWALLSLWCLVLMSGLLPWFWRIVPLVAKVQFPWRLMVVVEFSTITAVCLALAGMWSRPAKLCFAGSAFVLVLGLVPLVSSIALRVEEGLDQTIPPAQDAKEYLPAGYPQRPDAPYDDLSLELLHDVPTIACMPATRICRAEAMRFGEMRIDVEADTSTQVTLKRFWFPGSQVGDAIVPTASEPLRLVTFVQPAGRLSAMLHRVALPEEKIGLVVSGLSLILLLVWAAWEWRIRRP
jgi:uncharacterized membrane protein